jgi:hypothetical protein
MWNEFYDLLHLFDIKGPNYSLSRRIMPLGERRPNATEMKTMRNNRLPSCFPSSRMRPSSISRFVS